jgi:hypothetical protein
MYVMYVQHALLREHTTPMQLDDLFPCVSGKSTYDISYPLHWHSFISDSGLLGLPHEPLSVTM